jgi:hypothetical protein
MMRVPQLRSGDKKHKHHPSVKWQNLTQDTTNTGLWQVRELGDVHVPLKTMKQEWNSTHPESNVGLCASTSFKVYHTKLHFYGPTDTKLEKWSTQTEVHVTLSLWNWYISGVFSWLSNGCERKCEFYRLYENTETCEKGLCVCVCVFCLVLLHWEETKWEQLFGDVRK